MPACRTESAVLPISAGNSAIRSGGSLRPEPARVGHRARPGGVRGHSGDFRGVRAPGVEVERGARFFAGVDEREERRFSQACVGRAAGFYAGEAALFYDF